MVKGVVSRVRGVASVHVEQVWGGSDTIILEIFMYKRFQLYNVGGTTWQYKFR